MLLEPTKAQNEVTPIGPVALAAGASISLTLQPPFGEPSWVERFVLSPARQLQVERVQRGTVHLLDTNGHVANGLWAVFLPLVAWGRVYGGLEFPLIVVVHNSSGRQAIVRGFVEWGQVRVRAR